MRTTDFRTLAALVASFLLLSACGPSTQTARNHLKKGETKKAIEVLEALREKKPENLELRMELVDAYYQEARAELDAGNQEGFSEAFAKAEDELLYSVEKWPESYEPHLWYGIIRAYSGDLDASLSSFRNSLKLAKRDPRRIHGGNLYTNVAHIQVYRGEIGSARRYIDRGRKSGASLSEIERIELLAAWKSGDMVEARDIFDMAAGLTPGFADTWDGAPLPRPMESLEDFAGVCCSNPSCGPHMEGACKKMQREVARRELDDETIRKQLQMEMERKRKLKKVYEKRRDLEIEVE